MSYNFIKAHSGELKVETKEGEDAELLFNYHYSKFNIICFKNPPLNS
jgi:hypothetical protein